MFKQTNIKSTQTLKKDEDKEYVTKEGINRSKLHRHEVRYIREESFSCLERCTCQYVSIRQDYRLTPTAL